MRIFILGVLTFALACSSLRLPTGVLTIPPAEQESWWVTESIIRTKYPSVPANWVLMRDCRETEVVPERHVFEFVANFSGLRRAEVVEISCRMDTTGEMTGNAYCRAQMSRKQLFRSAAGFVVEFENGTGGADPELLVGQVGDLEAGVFEIGVDSLSRVWISETEVGCYASVAAKRTSKAGAVDWPSEVDSAICF